MFGFVLHLVGLRVGNAVPRSVVVAVAVVVGVVAVVALIANVIAAVVADAEDVVAELDRRFDRATHYDGVDTTARTVEKVSSWGCRAGVTRRIEEWWNVYSRKAIYAKGVGERERVRTTVEASEHTTLRNRRDPARVYTLIRSLLGML